MSDPFVAFAAGNPRMYLTGETRLGQAGTAFSSIAKRCFRAADSTVVTFALPTAGAWVDVADVELEVVTGDTILAACSPSFTPQGTGTAIARVVIVDADSTLVTGATGAADTGAIAVGTSSTTTTTVHDPGHTVDATGAVDAISPVLPLQFSASPTDTPVTTTPSIGLSRTCVATGTAHVKLQVSGSDDGNSVDFDTVFLTAPLARA